MNRPVFSLAFALALLTAGPLARAQDAAAAQADSTLVHSTLVDSTAIDSTSAESTAADSPTVESPSGDSSSVDSAVPIPVADPAADDRSVAATQESPGSDIAPAMQTTSAPPADPRTEAERDYDALYSPIGQGAFNQDYDPVADPTLPPPVELPASYDPWEKLNRKVHRFNNLIDRRIATPLAKAYVAVVPRPVRLGVGNFFNNLGQPVSAVNALLQGKPTQAAQALGRFVVNTTIGVVGIFDPATQLHLPNRSEDFGQTLGVWGWKRSRYVELPLFGPRTVRDVVGLVGDAPLSVIRQVGDDPTRVFLQGLQLVDIRTQLFAVDSMREGATDEYALFRDAWLQRRNYQIQGDRKQKGDESLPDYLRDDDTNPEVPAGSMPIIPGSSGP